MGRNGENGASDFFAAAQAFTEVDGEPAVEDILPRPIAQRLKPREAREIVLDSMSPEEQVETLRRAERVGPGIDDSDWLIASAALRVEKAANLAVKRIEEVAATIAPSTGEGLGAPARGARSLFDQCLDLCSSIAEREKLKSLAIRLHLAENAPPWSIVILHAESRAIFGPRPSAHPTQRPSWRTMLARLISDQP